MSLAQTLADELRDLEESLWRAETRFDPGHMERVLHPDFVEFGCSGRTYTREEALQVDEPDAEIPVTLPLPNFVVTELARGVMQVTYVSEEHWEDGSRHCNRSSIWTSTPSGWQIRFHQGTRILDES